MNLVVALEYRFESTPDGKIWTQTQFPYRFWLRYLEVFEQVRVVARVRQVLSVPADWQRADGAGVSFAAVPYYVGPWQFLKRAWQVQRAAINAVGAKDAVILRVGSMIADCMQPMLHRTGHPYGVEVVSDPYDVFAPGSVKHRLRPFLRWWFPPVLRRQCAGACAAAYVTEYALQRRYPPAPSTFSTYFSDVELPDSAFMSSCIPTKRMTDAIAIITVGTLAQLYKAPDVLIDAVAACVKKGLDLKLILVGDGQYRMELETRAAAQGLGKRVYFCGSLPAGDAVRSQLDQADLFVLPSYQEGLPRAMVEAMARAMPCIGSTVGGIPELLPPEDMVPPGDVAALAAKITEVVTNPERMARMSARNLEKAKAYTEEVLRERRLAFYRHVRETTETWVKVKNNITR